MQAMRKGDNPLTKFIVSADAVNADECLMTKIQEMSLNYHFKVEQQAGSSTIEFFGFNGESQLTSLLTLCQKDHPILFRTQELPEYGESLQWWRLKGGRKEQPWKTWI